MDYGESLTEGGRLLHCQQVGYEDCKLKQIVCPACKEALHKCGNPFTKREYLAHYKRKPDSLACEFRVASIVAQKLGRKPLIQRGQQLEEFLRQFEEIVLFPLPLALRQDIQSMLRRMRQRSIWRQIITRARPVLQENAQGKDWSGSLIDLFGPVALDVIDHLLGANSFTSLCFAVSYGCFVLHAERDRPDSTMGDPENAHLLEHLEAFLYLSDATLRRYCLARGDATSNIEMIVLAWTALATTTNSFLAEVSSIPPISK